MTYFSLYLLFCWSVIAAITWRLFPGVTALVGAVAIYSAAPIFLFIRRLRWNFYPGALFRVFVIRVLLYTQLTLPFVTGAALLGALIGWSFGAALPMARGFALVMLAGALVLFAIGYVGSRSLVTREVEARIPDLPPEFDGFRIVQLSDLHVGPQRSRAFLSRVVRNVVALRADLIAVTGDLIDDRPEDVEVYAMALGKLEAPHGVFMIAGNHDVYAGWSDVARELGRLVRGHVLVNESRLVHKGAARIAIVGTGDPAGAQRGAGAPVGPDIPRALSAVPPGTAAITLAHNPALFPSLAGRGVALTLSGHTHWGQFAIPKRGWSLASRVLQYAMGSYQIGDSLLYVSPGTGYWGIPFRIGALPEITAITLRSATVAGITMGESYRAQ
ncbi:MAG: metallophosphoesterase [Gemmatimonadaceae bacterium]